MLLVKWFCLLINIHWTTSVGNESLPGFITDEEFEYINKASLSIKISNSSGLKLPPIAIIQSALLTRPGFGSRLWRNGVVPYTIDRTFSESQRTEIALAIKQFHDNTCIRFVPLSTKHISWLRILQDSAVCGASDRCRRHGSQTARFGGSCINAGMIVHELGQTLCMSHEQTRRDRDKWIGFNEAICNAPKIDGVAYRGGLHKLYDYLSVEHHEVGCYNGCYLPKQPGIRRCGSGGVLSVLDIEILNEVYDCKKGCMGLRFVNISNSAALGDLVAVGHDLDGSPLYTCRAYHQGDIIPGKFKLATKECFLAWGGKEHKKTEDVEVLTNPHKVDLQLVANTASRPFNSVKGGRSNLRETLYVVRCQYILGEMMGWIPGKLHPSAGVFFSYAGREIRCITYQYLTCVGT